MSDEPSDPATGDNPYTAPHATDPPRPGMSRTRSVLRAVLFTVLGVVLVPPAAVICGVCCCTVGLVTSGGPKAPDYAFSIGFPFGAILGAVLAIACIVWLAKRTRRTVDASP